MWLCNTHILCSAIPPYTLTSDLQPHVHKLGVGDLSMHVDAPCQGVSAQVSVRVAPSTRLAPANTTGRDAGGLFCVKLL